MRVPPDSADITERLQHHIEWLARCSYPARLQRDALAEIQSLRRRLGDEGQVASGTPLPRDDETHA
jgi:hypothetical protein